MPKGPTRLGKKLEPPNRKKLTSMEKSIWRKAYQMVERWDDWIEPSSDPPVKRAGFVTFRDAHKRQGFTADQAWEQALVALPLPDEVYVRARDEYWARNLTSQKQVADKIAQMSAEDFQRMIPPPLLPQEEHTGIPLVDWIYANIAMRGALVGDVTTMELTRKPEHAGDLELLKFYRSNQEEFYTKVFMPALMRKHKVEAPPPDPQPEPVPADKATATTAELLSRLPPAPPGSELSVPPVDYATLANGVKP